MGLAENSRTVFEIYQPIIVGLGAVILGLLANSLLEWFKRALIEKSERRSLRYAILSELIHICDFTENSIRDFDEDIKSGSIPIIIPDYISSLDRGRLGALTKSEVIAVSKLMSSMAILKAGSSTQGEEEDIHLEMHFFIAQDAEMQAMVKKALGKYYGSACKAKTEIERNC